MTEELMKAADHAATASDRWLFLFTLIILGAAVCWLVKYFTSRTDRLEGEVIKLREEHVEYLKTSGKQTLETLVSTQEVLKDCAHALSESARSSERAAGMIQRLEERTR